VFGAHGNSFSAGGNFDVILADRTNAERLYVADAR
jgi:hypothetical protein